MPAVKSNDKPLFTQTKIKIGKEGDRAKYN